MLSWVSPFKWPHGAERQCANSTQAMSWPNHIQILSFASMASRQVAIKHGFVSKIAGGCSSYDVISPWPDLTWSFFLTKVAQGLPHKASQNRAAHSAAVFFAICLKPQGGGLHPPTLSGRGLISKGRWLAEGRWEVRWRWMARGGRVVGRDKWKRSWVAIPRRQESVRRFNPRLTGVSAERHWPGGGGRITPPPRLIPKPMTAARRARRRWKGLGEKVLKHS